MPETKPKKILITAARSPIALHIARQCHYGGHKVFATDTLRLNLCSFSNAVTKNIRVPSPRTNPKEFVDRILEIVEKEKIDLIIPVYEEIIYLSQARHLFPPYCQILTSPFELLNELHNKWLFSLKAQELGLGAPKTYLIRSEEALKKLDRNLTYAVKPCYSRASLHVFKLLPRTLLPDLKFESHNPWIAQEWIAGKQYCSYSVCKNGVMQAHAVYPYGYTADQKGCIVFNEIVHPQILAWVKAFVGMTKFTGQIAFDFIETEDNKLYAIECNPRATNGILLFDPEDRLDVALVDRTSSLIQPKSGASKQLLIAMLIYGWRKSAIPNNSFKKFIHEFLNSKDTIFSWRDPLPFFGQPFIIFEIFANSIKYGLSLPAFFMFDYEWNGE